MIYLHRTYCDTLEEMRSVVAHINLFTYKKQALILKSLISELQIHGNRMEAGLGYHHDIEKLHRQRKELAKEVKKLKGINTDADI